MTGKLKTLAIALGVTTMSVSADAQDAERPVRLVTSPGAKGMNLKIVGASAVARDFSYRLEVDGGAGGNKVRQAGTGRLVPGKSVTVADITVSGASGTATLSVDLPETRYRDSVTWPS